MGAGAVRIDMPGAGSYGQGMTLGRRLLTGALLLALVGCGWLYRENRLLRNQLDALNDKARAVAVSAKDSATPAPARLAAPEARHVDPDSAAASSGGSAPGPRPTLPPRAEETWGERRQRRQGEIAAMLGRLDGETPDAYRARMLPLLQTALVVPRQRMTEARRLAEDAAHVTAEQRTALDRVFDDAHAEALELTKRAIAEGGLTPYRRNWAGALEFAGGMGAVLGAAEARVAEILDSEQRRILYDQGFEWGEYLAVSVPWEQLEPPPPPDS
jgi:hypothetical protein